MEMLTGAIAIVFLIEMVLALVFMAGYVLGTRIEKRRAKAAAVDTDISASLKPPDEPRPDPIELERRKRKAKDLTDSFEKIMRYDTATALKRKNWAEGSE